MKKYKAIVVGGSGLGVQIAHQLVSYGIKPVALIEKNSLASGLTSKSGGMLKVFQDHPALSDLALESQAFYMQALTSKKTAHFKQTGALTFLAKSQLHKARQEIRRLQARGAQIDLLSAKSAREILPSLQWNESDFAVYEPQSGLLNASELSRALAMESEKQGLDIFENLKVLEFIADGHKISGVKTEQGDFCAPLTIMAAGAQTVDLLRSIGIGLEINVQPILYNEYHIEGVAETSPTVFEKRHTHRARIEVQPTGGCKLTLLVPTLDGTLQCGESLLAESQESKLAIKRLTQNFPFLKNAKWTTGSCIYDLQNTSSPGTLGFVPGYNGLYSVFGWGHAGLTLAPAISRQVMRQIHRVFQRSTAPTEQTNTTMSHLG